jgi:hypothetical protein
MSKPNGIIAILAYPDTVVRPADWEFLSKFLPYFGIGSEHTIQAGHAAFLLIKKNNSEINYFDFGRYITTYKNGRVRSKETDPELVIPISAKFENGSLSNFKEILLWLEKHPGKTHGEGRLIASINENIDYEKAVKFINTLLHKKEIPYGAFIKKGSNCARFVSEALRESSSQKRIKTKLKVSTILTPSPIGNVLKGKTIKDIFHVYNGELKFYKNRSILKEYKDCFFNKFETADNLIGTETPNNELFVPENGTWLGGIGSGAWFSIEEKTNINTYRISRYTHVGKKDFEGTFKGTDTRFDITQEYQFIHPSNCIEAFILQDKKRFSLKIINV